MSLLIKRSRAREKVAALRARSRLIDQRAVFQALTRKAGGTAVLARGRHQRPSDRFEEVSVAGIPIKGGLKSSRTLTKMSLMVQPSPSEAKVVEHLEALKRVDAKKRFEAGLFNRVGLDSLLDGAARTAATLGNFFAEEKTSDLSVLMGTILDGDCAAATQVAGHVAES